jgi:hypothetical protein
MAQLRAMVSDGATVAEMADRLGRERPSLRCKLAEMGLKAVPADRRAAQRERSSAPCCALVSRLPEIRWCDAPSVPGRDLCRAHMAQDVGTRTPVPAGRTPPAAQPAARPARGANR